MPVSFLDLGVIAVVLISAGLAMVRGFTREVLSIVSWVAAAVAALWLHPQVLPYIRDYITNPTGALVAAIAVVFLLTLVIVSLITVKISDFILDSKVGALDRSLGFLFGAARGALICVIGFIFFSWLVNDKMQPQWVRDARTRPMLEVAGQQLLAMLPDDPESAILRQLKQRQLQGAPEPADREPGQTPTPPPAGAPVPQQRSDLGIRR